jgi:primosomal protein N' (replication factor Y)
MKGFGTEKVEDELPIFFPECKVDRMDFDTTRSKHSYHRIIHNFEERKIDILVGTQMVSKGLDFDNVSLVGILNADNMLNFPDFRTFERSFQQLSQVSGRAGRKSKQGRVIIQTSNPGHPVIKFVVNNDYLGMYKSQLNERNTFKYPPFYRLIKITLKHKDLDLLNEAAGNLGKTFRQLFGDRVLGPEFPIIAKIRNYFIKDIIIKLEKNSSVTSFKDKIQEKLSFFSMTYKTIRVIIDVDPQ